MKNNLKNLILITSLFGFLSCNKEDELVSTIVPEIYPDIVLTGDPVLAVTLGGSYTEAGAVAIDSSVTPPVVTVLTPIFNNVNTDTAGFYSVKYTAKTTNGFISNATRLVLVTDFDPNVDLSGTYARVSNGQTATITKKGTGLYTTDNVGGVADNPSYIYDVYFAQLNDSTIVVPTQPNALGGDITCEDVTLNVSISDTVISWVVVGSGYGPALRVFEHQ